MNAWVHITLRGARERLRSTSRQPKKISNALIERLSSCLSLYQANNKLVMEALESTFPFIGFLYGRMIPNQQWLERRKNSRNIHDLEDALSEGSTSSKFAKLAVYLAALKTDAGAIRLFDFYSSPSVRRRLWDNHLAQRSAMDRACHLGMQQGAITSHGNTSLPVIYAFGLDGMSKRARKGALAPMDHKFSRHL